MQWTRGKRNLPTPHGIEAWLPALILAVTQVILAVALAWFLIGVHTPQGRNELPRVVMPGAKVVAGILAVIMLARAWRAFRGVRDTLRKR